MLVQRMALLGCRSASGLRLVTSVPVSWSVSRRLAHSHTLSAAPSLGPGNVELIHSHTSLLVPHISLQYQKRNYAKGKDKKGKSKQSKARVTNEEMAELVNVTKMLDHFDHILDSLKQDYIKNLSLRTATGSLETLEVELEGDSYPLNEVAQVVRKSPQMVLINAAAFPQALPGIIKAIREAGMNLNPQQEGTSIILPIPKVTKEHRESLAKSAKVLYNRCKDQLRDAQAQYMKKVKNKEGTVSEDLIFNGQLRIRELAEIRMMEAETMMTAKQMELLQTNK